LHDKTFAHGLENKSGKAGVQSKMKKSSNPVPRPPGSTLDPVNEQRQFLRTQALAPALTHRRGVSPPLQPFAQNPQARPVMRQNFKPVAPFIQKYEPMALAAR
jgi:hypothetical protein